MDVLATTTPARRLGLALNLTTALVMTAFATVYALNRFTDLDLRKIKGAVDIGGENNIPTWWNGLLLLAVAVAAATAAFARTAASGGRPPRRAETWSWLVIAGAAAYLTLDELAQLHERLNEPVRSTGIDLPTYAWLLPGVVIAATGALVLIRAARTLPPRVARRLGIALACYLAGAIGMEAINGLFSGRWLDLELVFAAGTTLEETLEMAACILALTAIVDHLAARPTDLTGRHRAPRTTATSATNGTSSDSRTALAGSPSVVATASPSAWASGTDGRTVTELAAPAAAAPPSTYS